MCDVAQEHSWGSEEACAPAAACPPQLVRTRPPNVQWAASNATRARKGGWAGMPRGVAWSAQGGTLHVSVLCSLCESAVHGLGLRVFLLDRAAQWSVGGLSLGNLASADRALNFLICVLVAV